MSLLFRFIVLCKDTVNDFLGKNCPHLAAAIAFYAFFSLFPLVLALVSALGFFLGSRSAQAELAQDIGALVPVSEQLVTSTIQGVVQARAITGVIGILGLFWAGSAVFGAIRKGVNTAWGIREPRPFLRERLLDLSLMFGAGLLILLSVFTTAILGFFQELSDLWFPGLASGGDFIWEQLARLIPPVLTFVTFLILYRMLPNTRVRVREAWLGAMVATIAFEVVKNGFVWYARSYASYNLVYGPVAAVVVLLAWTYLSAVILHMGALVTSRYAGYLASKMEEKRDQVLASLRRVRQRALEFRQNV